MNATIFEIVTAIALFFGVGHLTDKWGTNPFLKHPAARIVIGLLAVAIYLGNSYYQGDQEDWKLAKMMDKPCAYLEEHPKGFHADEARKTCGSSNSEPSAYETPPAETSNRVEKYEPSPIVDTATKEKKWPLKVSDVYIKNLLIFLLILTASDLWLKYISINFILQIISIYGNMLFTGFCIHPFFPIDKHNGGILDVILILIYGGLIVASSFIHYYMLSMLPGGHSVDDMYDL